MNEKIYRILFYVMLAFSLLFAGSATVLSFRYANAERELGCCRDELNRVRKLLADANDQEQSLRQGIEQCLEISADTSAILNKSATTLSELREQIRIIRENYEAMEACLRNYSGGSSSNDNGSCDNTSE